MKLFSDTEAENNMYRGKTLIFLYYFSFHDSKLQNEIKRILNKKVSDILDPRCSASINS